MNIIKRIIFPVLLLAMVFVVSCNPPTKLDKVTYLYGINPGETYTTGPVPDEYSIRTNDQLYIQVISDDPLNAAFLNLNSVQNASNAGSSPGSMELITYLVDNEGNIDYPQLGKIKVSGLMTGEVREIIQKGVDKYLQSASVFVKLVNRNITVLGEVRSPGQQLMVKNQLTIFEALGTAGDITDWGNFQNVKIIREVPEGRFVGELDLTTANVIQSPYYYILPHDIVYVERREKVFGDKNVPFGQRLSLGLSVISIALLTLNLFLL
jgi:polysaccharide export outer membrane protein